MYWQKRPGKTSTKEGARGILVEGFVVYLEQGFLSLISFYFQSTLSITWKQSKQTKHKNPPNKHKGFQWYTATKYCFLNQRTAASFIFITKNTLCLSISSKWLDTYCYYMVQLQIPGWEKTCRKCCNIKVALGSELLYSLSKSRALINGGFSLLIS